MLEAALGLVARWPRAIFPTHSIRAGVCSCGRAECGSPGKHPRTRRGVYDARWADAARVRAWWGSWPDANIGLATGSPSGLYVVDLDGDAGVEEWMRLIFEHGETPATLTSRTGGGGMHLFYRLPDGLSLPNTAKRLSPGVDTRGSGGYVLLPPSNHASGQRYEWVGARPVAPLPAWVVAAVRERDRSAPTGPRPFAVNAQGDGDLALRIVDEEARSVAGTPRGGRNDALYRASFKLATLAWGGEMTVRTVGVRMREAATAAGLPQREAEQTICSAIEAARDAPRRIQTRKENRGHVHSERQAGDASPA